MSTQPARIEVRESEFEQLRFAKSVLRSEASAIALVAEQLSQAFCEAVRAIHACSGALVVCGMGKAGLVGRKLSASFCSTGTPSHFLHPAEAFHGDLGAVRRDDVVLILSSSGETEEVVRIIAPLQKSGAQIIGLTNRSESTLAKRADLTLTLGPVEEACHLGLAPSTSTAVMLAVGDALALTVSRQRGFEREDFARFHPGGSLGRKLSKVDEAMRPLAQCRVASDALTVRQVLTREPQPGRRSGAILLVDDTGRLSGVFTDSDLARMLSRNQWDGLDHPIRDEMTTTPKIVVSGQLLEDAVAILDKYKISELPIVSTTGEPVGLLDITDVLGLSSFRPEEDAGPKASSEETQPIAEDDEGDPAITISFPKPNDKSQ